MYTRIAFTGVIIIWATTPLAIQWSSEGVGFLFALAARMTLGVAASWVLLRWLGQSLPLHGRALRTYLISGLNIYLSMCCVYWASQYIPSGWVSVVFGLSPIITGVLAMLLLGENALLPNRLLGMLIGVAGLMLIFGNGYYAGREFMFGIAAVLIGTVIHSFSAVMIKRLQAGLSGIAATSGGLAIATPLFVLSWVAIEGEMPATVSPRALFATVYLGIVATTAGFAMYYYILTRMEVSRVALITLITPVCALLLGNLLNNEPVGPVVLTGTALIVGGLLCYEYGCKLIR